MKAALKYFSGTGNSYRALNECKEIFAQNGFEVEFSSITYKTDIDKEADLIGFCFPVYAFDIPRICRNYLLSLAKMSKSTKTFILITAGDAEESGFSIQETIKILKKKNLRVVYSKVIQMPSNWTVSMNPPSKEDAQLIINNGVKKAKKAAKDILNNVVYHHQFNYPPRYSKFGFYKDYYLFKWLGVSNLWRNFRTDDTCNSCGLCSEICPTNSIQIVDEKPNWLKSCEQCMRCVNYCPNQAIFQKGEGSIKGKNIYYEPSFKPLKLMKQSKV
ncbi:EFR1 family ferrodoxin [Desulfobacterales bacterium HSG17]|nr:EFR1 family ferrodoxin [Desulfobacterales bacterium HSG17]